MPEYGRSLSSCCPDNLAVMAIHHRGFGFCELGRLIFLVDSVGFALRFCFGLSICGSSGAGDASDAAFTTDV